MVGTVGTKLDSRRALVGTVGTVGTVGAVGTKPRGVKGTLSLLKACGFKTCFSWGRWDPVAVGTQWPLGPATKGVEVKYQTSQMQIW